MADSRHITRRRILKVLGFLGLPTPLAAADTNTGLPANVMKDEAILLAYWNWLEYERKTLQEELQPGTTRTGRWVPCNTGVDDYHMPAMHKLFGAGHRDRIATQGLFNPVADLMPSDRAAIVLEAVGINTELLVEQQGAGS